MYRVVRWLYSKFRVLGYGLGFGGSGSIVPIKQAKTGYEDFVNTNPNRIFATSCFSFLINGPSVFIGATTFYDDL